MPDQLIIYVLENGGIWGFLFTLSTLFNIMLITNPSIFKKKDKEAETKAPEIIIPPESTVFLKSEIHELKNTLENIERRVVHLDDLHNVKDEDGVPIWYIRKSLVETIVEIKKNTYKSIEVLNKISLDQEAIAIENSESYNQYKELIAEYHGTLRDLLLGLERLKLEIESRGI